MKFAKNKLVSGKVIVQAVLELNSVMAVGMNDHRGSMNLLHADLSPLYPKTHH